jgi:hypothetical protein
MLVKLVGESDELAAFLLNRGLNLVLFSSSHLAFLPVSRVGTRRPKGLDQRLCITARGRTMRSVEPTVSSERETHGTHDTITKHDEIITFVSHFSAWPSDTVVLQKIFGKCNGHEEMLHVQLRKLVHWGINPSMIM